jgi:hypothetical protein
MAKERAKYYLGEHAGDVLNHLPDIKHSENHPRCSTGLVREFLGVSKSGARLPSFMLVQKLHSLNSVKPTDVVARIWEIIRCEYLTRILSPFIAFLNQCFRPLPSLANRDCPRRHQLPESHGQKEQ